MSHLKRRDFLKQSALAGAALVLPVHGFSLHSKFETLRFGLIADVHKDIMHDADQRLQAFIDASHKRKLDFIMQMGDFCVPHQRNNSFMKVWNSYKGEKYHILGNHDTDGGFTQDQTKAYWNMPSNYYSFDKKGVHFVVLDGNDKNPKPWSGYNRFIGKKQQEWLKADLKATKKPTVIFSHQTLELEETGVANLKDIQNILENANKEAGFKKVICCMCGHDHTDFATQINGIYYVQINSASYHWVGGNFKTIRYNKAIDEKYPWIKYTIPYKDPLFTFVKITHNKIIIEPRKTEFVGPGPNDMKGLKKHPHNPIVPFISKVKMKI